MSNFFSRDYKSFLHYNNENQTYFYYLYTRCAAIGDSVRYLLPVLLLRAGYRLVSVPSEVVHRRQTLVPRAAGTRLFFFTTY